MPGEGLSARRESVIEVFAGASIAGVCQNMTSIPRWGRSLIERHIRLNSPSSRPSPVGTGEGAKDPRPRLRGRGWYGVPGEGLLRSMDNSRRGCCRIDRRKKSSNDSRPTVLSSELLEATSIRFGRFCRSLDPLIGKVFPPCSAGTTGTLDEGWRVGL